LLLLDSNYLCHKLGQVFHQLDSVLMHLPYKDSLTYKCTTFHRYNIFQLGKKLWQFKILVHLHHKVDHLNTILVLHYLQGNRINQGKGKQSSRRLPKVGNNNQLHTGCKLAFRCLFSNIQQGMGLVIPSPNLCTSDPQDK
jgi:hypothetical protein